MIYCFSSLKKTPGSPSEILRPKTRLPKDRQRTVFDGRGVTGEKKFTFEFVIDK